MTGGIRIILLQVMDPQPGNKKFLDGLVDESDATFCYTDGYGLRMS
jgi:hypothetical protein